MNFLAAWFNPASALAAHFILAALLAACAKPAFAAVSARPAATGVAAVFLSVLWSLNAGVGGGQLAGMNFHLLGISLAALMLGAPAALWLGTLLLVPYTWLHGAENLHAVSLNVLFLILPSAALNLSCRRIAAKLPANLFVYIFFNGFIAAALGMILTGALLAVLLQTVQAYSGEVLWTSVFPVFFLLAWGEAFLTGIFTAIFVALRPQFLATFDDNRYLRSENEIWKS
ncbi:MAG: energy-coupling factor ABC transporter permease [Neisseria animaloris]|nr:energy-coupling factor ABC transporter permease [Neisseria animaloris]